jgi:hypothetical protein
MNLRSKVLAAAAGAEDDADVLVGAVSFVVAVGSGCRGRSDWLVWWLRSWMGLRSKVLAAAARAETVKHKTCWVAQNPMDTSMPTVCILGPEVLITIPTSMSSWYDPV